MPKKPVIFQPIGEDFDDVFNTLANTHTPTERTPKEKLDKKKKERENKQDSNKGDL